MFKDENCFWIVIFFFGTIMQNELLKKNYFMCFLCVSVSYLQGNAFALITASTSSFNASPPSPLYFIYFVFFKNDAELLLIDLSISLRSFARELKIPCIIYGFVFYLLSPFLHWKELIFVESRQHFSDCNSWKLMIMMMISPDVAAPKVLTCWSYDCFFLLQQIKVVVLIWISNFISR